MFGTTIYIDDQNVEIIGTISLTVIQVLCPHYSDNVTRVHRCLPIVTQQISIL
jgi:hypothetical protein